MEYIFIEQSITEADCETISTTTAADEQETDTDQNENSPLMTVPSVIKNELDEILSKEWLAQNPRG